MPLCCWDGMYLLSLQLAHLYLGSMNRLSKVGSFENRDGRDFKLGPVATKAIAKIGSSAVCIAIMHQILSVHLSHVNCNTRHIQFKQMSGQGEYSLK